MFGLMSGNLNPFTPKFKDVVRIGSKTYDINFNLSKLLYENRLVLHNVCCDISGETEEKAVIDHSMYLYLSIWQPTSIGCYQQVACQQFLTLNKRAIISDLLFSSCWFFFL